MTGWGCNDTPEVPARAKPSFFGGRVIMWVAASLLTLQGFVIYADTVIETFFFDELLGFGINAALVYLIAKQRKILKGA